MTTPSPSERATGVKTTWTPQKLNQAWRIFDKALVVMADGIHVPADELRAFLIEGKKPTIPTVQQRVRQCHDENPEWTARQVADHLGAAYDVVRGMGSREGIKWPPSTEDLDKALVGAPTGTKFRLQSYAGGYLHMECKGYTKEPDYAWFGTAAQLRVVRERFPAAKTLRAVAINDPRLQPNVR